MGGTEERWRVEERAEEIFNSESHVSVEYLTISLYIVGFGVQFIHIGRCPLPAHTGIIHDVVALSRTKDVKDRSSAH